MDILRLIDIPHSEAILKSLYLVAQELICPISVFFLYDLGQNNSGAANCWSRTSQDNYEVRVMNQDSLVLFHPTSVI